MRNIAQMVERRILNPEGVSSNLTVSLSFYILKKGERNGRVEDQKHINEGYCREGRN